MSLPTNVGTGTVVWNGIDSSGANVDGTVTFTPSPVKLLNVTATPAPVTILPKPVTTTLVDGGLTQVLIATNDPDNNPSGWTYKVTFKLGGGVTLPSFDIAVPEDETVDLSVVAPVATANGVTITRGEGVPTGGTTGQVLAKASNADDDTEWTTVEGGGVTSVAGKTGAVTLVKADVGLSNVDNTTDAAKPVSTAQATALALKAPLASPAFTGTPTGITKTHVGLGNVDNTTDANKPVSTATQTALDDKADTTHAHAFTDLTDVSSTLSPANGEAPLWNGTSGEWEYGTPTGTTDAAALTTGQLGIERLTPGSVIVVDYNKDVYGAANAWPASRPTARTDIVVQWLGPSDPGTIAIAGDIIDLTSV